MPSKILVTGAAGFIGSAVCRHALAAGHEVVGIAHHGPPPRAGAWADRVAWVTADVLQPDDWRTHLDGCEAVVHAVGTAQAASDAAFERLNGDAAETAAWEAEHAGVSRFVFLSAAVRPPLVPRAYLDAKRRAEASLRGRGVRETLLRPAFVYGPGRPATLPLAALDALGRLPWLRRRLRRVRPLHVDQVAAAAVRAATEPGYEGVLTADDIAWLARDAPPSAPARRAAGRPLLAVGAAAVLVGLAAGLWARRGR